MEFDKLRVFSAVNADELKVGSKCVFADTVKALRKKVQSDEYIQYVQPFIRLLDNGYDVQFLAGCYLYNYAYLIEPPAEPKYRLFSSIGKAKEIIDKHGGWVKNKKSDSQYLLIGIGRNAVYLGDGYARGFNDMFSDFVFADDGSPCGELVEETK